MSNAHTLSRFTFGSCAYHHVEQPIWDSVVAANPQLFLFLGDTIYADHPPEDAYQIDKMRAKYEHLSTVPGYKRLLATCPVLATWDDHDYGFDDAGAEFPYKEESQQIFLDFFGVPQQSYRRYRKGVYHAEIFGPAGRRVQVILLDTRFHRCDRDGQMLGFEQWKWLEGQLRVPAELRVICSSIQVIAEHPNLPEVPDRWDKCRQNGTPIELYRLLELVKSEATRNAGVIVLSGDVHWGELSLLDGFLGFPLYELTSSGLNAGGGVQAQRYYNRRRIGDIFIENNFGLVQIDWEQDDPLIRLVICDSNGRQTSVAVEFPLSTIRPAAH